MHSSITKKNSRTGHETTSTLLYNLHVKRSQDDEEKYKKYLVLQNVDIFFICIEMFFWHIIMFFYLINQYIFLIPGFKKNIFFLYLCSFFSSLLVKFWTNYDFLVFTMWKSISNSIRISKKVKNYILMPPFQVTYRYAEKILNKYSTYIMIRNHTL